MKQSRIGLGLHLGWGALAGLLRWWPRGRTSFTETIYHARCKTISHRLKGFAYVSFDKFGPLPYLHRLPCVFLFSFPWPKVSQSPTSLCYMLLVDVLRTHKVGLSLCYMLLVDLLRTHEVGMTSHVTCKKGICSLAVSRFIFSALFFSSSNNLVSPIHFPFPSHAFSFIHCTNFFSLILFLFYLFSFPFYLLTYFSSISK